MPLFKKQTAFLSEGRAKSTDNLKTQLSAVSPRFCTFGRRRPLKSLNSINLEGMKHTAHFSWLSHVLFWIFYLGFKTYYEWLWIYPRYESINWDTAFRMALVAQCCMLPPKMGFTYWIIYRFLPQSGHGFLRAVRFVAALGLTLLSYRILVVYLALPVAYHEAPDTQPLLSGYRIAAAAVDTLLVTGIAAAIVLYLQRQATERHAVLLQREKLAGELQLLRQQVHPHFLFNTLNNLYGLARKQSPSTAAAILQLANLMSYLLHESQKPQVALKQEVELIEQLASLESLRYGERLTFEFQRPEQLDEIHVAPLLLLPLVENAFKHGASESEGEASIHLHLWQEGERLFFRVTNSIGPASSASGRQGVGLSNLKRQLELQYPSHRLYTRQDTLFFTAQLEINPLEYENLAMPDS